MKNKVTSLLAVVSIFLAAAAAQAQTNWYGVPTGADAYANTILGGSMVARAEAGPLTANNTVVGAYSLGSMTSGNFNLALGFGSGAGLLTGSNNTYIGSVAALANDQSIIRLGAPGQTNIYFSGVITSTPLTNVTTIAQGSTGYTNNTTADVFVYIYPTNYAITFYAGAQGTNAIITTGAVGTPGPYSFHVPPGWCLVGTNVAGKVVNSL